MNAKKLKGIAMIINAAFPLLGGVAILVILTTIVIDLKHLVQGPAKQLGSSLASISAKVSQTGKAIGSATKSVADIQQKLVATVRKIDRIPEEIEIPKIGIPNINLRIKPRVTIASRQFTPGYSLEEYAHDRPIFIDNVSAEYQPAVWHSSQQRPRLIRAGFSKPKIPTPSIPKPSIPKPSIPKPSLPSVKVDWDNLNVPMPVIPTTRVPVPGLKQVRSLLSQNAGILREMRNLLGIGPLLDTLRTSAQILTGEKQGFIRTVSMLGGKLLALVGSTKQSISFMKSIGIKLLIIIILAVLIAAPWFYVVYVKPYFNWSFGYISRGWQLL